MGMLGALAGSTGPFDFELCLRLNRSGVFFLTDFDPVFAKFKQHLKRQNSENTNI